MTHMAGEITVRHSLMTGTAGFTLVESMVSLVVLSIGVIGTIGMFEWAEHGL